MSYKDGRCRVLETGALSFTLIRRSRQHTLGSRSSIGASSLSSLAQTHTHAAPGRSWACVSASSFSRQFTSVNMCGNPRAHVLRASHWLAPRRRRTPLVGPSSQWLLPESVIGRRSGHSRSCPLMYRPCVRCRAGRLEPTTASGV